MKRIKYKLQAQHDSEFCETENCTHAPHFVLRTLPYSEKNEEEAKIYAYNGEYEIFDDGKPEPELTPTTEQRVHDLEEQLVQADETAIALYEAQETQETINAQQDEALMELYEMKY